jgi:glutaredoxin 3
MLQLYSKNHCPQCDKAKSLLNQKNIKFKEIKIDEDTSARQFLIDAGHKSVPQIYKDSQLFVDGGYNGLVKLSDSEFKQLLES